MGYFWIGICIIISGLLIVVKLDDICKALYSIKQELNKLSEL